MKLKFVFLARAPQRRKEEKRVSWGHSLKLSSQLGGLDVIHHEVSLGVQLGHLLPEAVDGLFPFGLDLLLGQDTSMAACREKTLGGKMWILRPSTTKNQMITEPLNDPVTIFIFFLNVWIHCWQKNKTHQKWLQEQGSLQQPSCWLTDSTPTEQRANGTQFTYCRTHTSIFKRKLFVLSWDFFELLKLNNTTQTVYRHLKRLA